MDWKERVIDEAVEAIFTVDADGTLLSFNHSAEQMFRCFAADAIGQPLERLLPERLRCGHQQLFRRFFDSGVQSMNMSGRAPVTAMRASGEEFLVDISLVRVDLPDGQPGAAAIIRDATERSQAEAAAAEAQRYQSMVLLAGGVAHDFNNILAVILGNTDLALASLDEPAIAGEALEDVRSAALRAAELARQMLVYAGKAESRRELVEIGPIADDTVKLLRGSVGATSLRCSHDTDLPPIEADPTRIRQVVMNLVINASDAIGGEPGIIRVAAYPVHAEEPWWAGAHLAPPEPEGDFVCLEVVDTGGGMEPDVLSRIFEPFFSTKFPGRGLGLATTIGIVRSHGGGIRVTSEPGQGTRFRVYFPAASRA